jgi:hypothetical protein
MRRLLAFLVLWLFAAPAWSYYGTAGAPAGWGGAAGQWFFGGPGTQGATWVGSQANVSATFGGRQVPAKLNLGSGAAQTIMRAALTTPYGRAASFIAFAVAAGWAWSEAEQRWYAQETEAAYADTVYFWVLGSSENPRFNSVGELCNAQSGSAYQGATRLVPGSSAAWPGNEQCQVYTDAPGTNPDYWQNVNQGVIARPGYTCGQVYSTHPTGAKVSVPQGHGCPTGTTHPATEVDADQLAQAQPLPDAVVNEAQQYVPLPQALPEVQPSRIPTGAPVPQGTEPETYRQPVTDITPAPTTNEPWRVDATPREILGSSPTGVTDVQHLDGSQDPATEEETPGLCDQYPDIVACQQLGDPPSDDVPSRVEAVQYAPESIGGASGCPAPIPMGDHQLSFTEFCDNLTTIRPLVILIGFFIAAMVIVNALRV